MESDERLMELSQQGDREAFGTIVDRYENLIYSICYRMLGHVEDAKSQAQQTFLKAWEHRENFDTDRRLKPWICRIASNGCSEYLRKASTRYEKSGVDPPPADGSGTTALARLERTELGNEIQEALRELPPDYRRLIVMKYLGDCTYTEMAEEIGLTESAVESRLHRARQKLRDRLQDVGEEYFNE